MCEVMEQIWEAVGDQAIHVVDTGDQVCAFSGSSAQLDVMVKDTRALVLFRSFPRTNLKKSTMNKPAARTRRPPGSSTKNDSLNKSVEEANTEQVRFQVLCEGWSKQKEKPQTEPRESFSYMQLVANREWGESGSMLPAWVDWSRPEQHMNDEDFDRVFGMRRSQFLVLPTWQQSYIRKQKRLSRPT